MTPDPEQRAADRHHALLVQGLIAAGLFMMGAAVWLQVVVR